MIANTMADQFLSHADAFLFFFFCLLSILGMCEYGRLYWDALESLSKFRYSFFDFRFSHDIDHGAKDFLFAFTGVELITIWEVHFSI